MHSADEPEHDLPVSRQIMTATLAIVMLVSPMFIVLQASMGSLLLVIYAPTWMFSPNPYMPFFISPIVLLSNFPFYGFKIVFVYFIHKCYSAEKTKKTTIRIGILSEVVPFLFWMAPYIMIMFISRYGGYLPFVIPIPILFVLGYIILNRWPPPDIPTWIESDTEAMWWEREESTKHSESEEDDVWP